MIEEQPQKRSAMDWLKESVTIKLIFIGILILVLLIPSSLVENLITERATRQDDMMRDVSEKWSGSQLIKGPVLIIPYKKAVKYMDAASKESTREIIENLYILPDNLHIRATLNTQLLHRGIFDVAVYNSVVKISGNFSKADLGSLSLTADQLLLNKAHIAFSISDLKGLKNNPVLKAAGQTLPVEPIFDNRSLFGSGLQAGIDLSNAADGEVPFDYTLDLKGSQELSFLHLGKLLM